jgi:hypothetical protein
MIPQRWSVAKSYEENLEKQHGSFFDLPQENPQCYAFQLRIDDRDTPDLTRASGGKRPATPTCRRANPDEVND